MPGWQYHVDSWSITLLLFVSMAAALELSYRIGKKRKEATPETFRSHVSSIQSSILGTLALVLGFTFSLALQRYDTRSAAVVDEANSIRTAFHETRLLPEPMRGEARLLLREYVDTRVESGRFTTVDFPAQARILPRTVSIQEKLWEVTGRALEVNPEARGTLMFASAVGELIDSFYRRKASLDRRVPETVLVLLYVTFVMAGAVVGFAAGVAGHRPSGASWIMVILISLLVFVILDLDRPGRGLIKVNQGQLIDLQAQLRADRS